MSNKTSRNTYPGIITNSPYKRKLIQVPANTPIAKKRLTTDNTDIICHCVICASQIYDGFEGEKSIQCTKCNEWCHEQCIDNPESFKYCDFCI